MRQNKTPVIRLVCATIFVAFTFAWLFCFQADMLALAQHGLSGGQTHYERTIGAVITTAVLLAIHLLVYGLTRLSGRIHALTYFPSMLLLAFLSSTSYPFSWGAWLWAGPLLLVGWSGAVWMGRQSQTTKSFRLPSGLFSQSMWLNLLQMIAMMAGVAAVSNTNAVDHFKAHAEVALTNGDAEEALKAGARSLETDEHLTMLRIFALSQKGELPERLFGFALAGSSADMLPLAGSKSRLLLMPDSLLWQHFGLNPADSLRQTTLSVHAYLDSLERDTLATTAFRDYRLMGQLIDRNLSTFVATLPRYYILDADSLPRHYREALVMWQQQCDTLFIYSDTLMLRRWHDYRGNDTIYLLPSERRLRTFDDYGDTYWYYYDADTTCSQP